MNRLGKVMIALVWALLALVGTFTANSLHAQDRVALLIANSDYGQVKLPETRQGVDKLATSLTSAGFVVTVKENVGKTLRQDVESFALSCPDGGVSLLYFAGFGNRIQRKVFTTVTKPDGSKEKVESLEWATGIQPVGTSHFLMSDIARIFRERSTARLHLLLFDCAYAKPALPESEQQGMDEIDPAEFPSTMLCFAMPPKQTLPEGTSSYLAESLTRHIVVTDRGIGETMRFVRDDVKKASGGKQTPWYGFSLARDATAQVVSSRKRNIYSTKLPPANPKPGDEWINGLGMVFVWCPPGSFRMGISGSVKFDAVDAKPVDVTIGKGFWIGKYEMAYGTYRHRLRKGPSRTPLVEHGNVPMTFIQGPRATQTGVLIAGVEEKAGRIPNGWEYRLPTEAEWEYACRAGSSARYSYGDSAAELHRYANYADASLYRFDDSLYYCDLSADDGVAKRPAAIGSYEPNAWGIHDMHGNVSEFCQDGYETALPGGTDPKAVGRKETIVHRGGAWCSLSEYCLAGFRHFTVHSYNNGDASHLGLRMVLARKK